MMQTLDFGPKLFKYYVNYEKFGTFLKHLVFLNALIIIWITQGFLRIELYTISIEKIVTYF
jgi:hypothetical protein